MAVEASVAGYGCREASEVMAGVRIRQGRNASGAALWVVVSSLSCLRSQPDGRWSSVLDKERGQRCKTRLGQESIALFGEPSGLALPCTASRAAARGWVRRDGVLSNSRRMGRRRSNNNAGHTMQRAMPRWEGGGGD